MAAGHAASDGTESGGGGEGGDAAGNEDESDDDGGVWQEGPDGSYHRVGAKRPREPATADKKLSWV